MRCKNNLERVSQFCYGDDEVEIDKNYKPLRDALFESFKGRCFYTRQKLSEYDFHVDHVVPVSSGGQDVIPNYVICSPEINIDKGAFVNFSEVEPALYLIKTVYLPKVRKKLLRFMQTRTVRAKGVSKNTAPTGLRAGINHPRYVHGRFVGTSTKQAQDDVRARSVIIRFKYLEEIHGKNIVEILEEWGLEYGERVLCKLPPRRLREFSEHLNQLKQKLNL